MEAPNTHIQSNRSNGDEEYELFPCSATQSRIWFSQQMSPDSNHWNIAMRWRLVGTIREAAVEQAWSNIVERHEALRTSIADVEGVPYQRVEKNVQVKMSAIDSTRLPEDKRQAAVDEYVRRDAARVIDIGAAPLLRLEFIRVSEDTAYLLTCFHHIIADGWSVGLLIKEFGDELEAIENGKVLPGETPAVQHIDYTLWQSDLLSTAGLAAERSFWQDCLAGYERFELPAHHPRPQQLKFEGKIRTRLLEPVDTDAIRAFVRKQGVSLFTLGGAMLSLVLGRSAEDEDVVMATEAACRTEPELEGVVGPLINTVLLRLDTGGDPSLKQFIWACKDRIASALEHQELPFNEVVDLVQPRRDPSRNLLFSVSYTAQAAHIDRGTSRDLAFDGFRIEAMPSVPVGAMTDLTFFIVEREEGLRASCLYNPTLFDAEQVDKLLAEWQTYLVTVVRSDLATNLSAFPGRVRAGKAVQPRSVVQEQATPTTSNETELIAKVWADVLGLQSVPPETDFFDAGGNSLRAMRMIAQINKARTKRVPVQALFRAPVFADFVEQLTEVGSVPLVTPAANIATLDEPALPTTIVALNNGSAFVPLQRELGENSNLIDVPCGTEDDAEFARTHSYAESIARISDRVTATIEIGPVFILGYCAVGQVAIEVARRLRSEGHSIKGVVLLDTLSFTYQRDTLLKGRILRTGLQLKEAWSNAVLLVRMLARGEITAAVYLEHYGFIRASGLTGFLVRRGWIEPLPHADESVLGFEFFDALDKARGSQAINPIDFPIVLCRSREMSRGAHFPEASGWRRYAAGRLDVIEADCTHTELAQMPGAKLIAEPLIEALREILSSASEVSPVQKRRAAQ